QRFSSGHLVAACVVVATMALIVLRGMVRMRARPDDPHVSLPALPAEERGCLPASPRRIASSLTLRDRGRCLRGPSNSVHEAKFMTTIASQKPALPCALSEPPIGIEPMTYALREARFPAPSARAALMHRLGRSECPECPESTHIRSTTRSTTPDNPSHAA